VIRAQSAVAGDASPRHKAPTIPATDRSPTSPTTTLLAATTTAVRITSRTGEAGVAGSVNGICVVTMMHGKVSPLGYILGHRHSRLEDGGRALATERARKKARNQLALVIGASIIVSTAIWTFLSMLP
jgi:hypothetical protein